MQSKDSHSEKPALDYLFHPRSIAIAGVSARATRLGGGRQFLEGLINAGFKGKIYPVSPSRGEILGLKIYPGIKDIPDRVDYVISAIPAQYTPQLIIDCATKGTKAVHMFTAGFSELGDEQGKQLESQITSIAHQTGIRVIGPNCLGLYCPKTRLSFHPDFPKRSGAVGFITQSGGNGMYTVLDASMRGTYFSKVISYGNACDLNESDFLEYLAHDSGTEIIAGYIEGVKQGTRFAEVLKQAAKLKPVIIYKAGATEGGTKAAASHTGAIAGSGRIWDSLLKQAGAIQVHNMEELIDLIVLFTHMAPPEGRRIAILGMGGGNLVQAADACSNNGLTVPSLPAETRERLRAIYTSETGGSFGNPVDMYWRKGDLFQKAISTVADCSQIDLLLIQMMIGIGDQVLEPYLDSINSLSKYINKRTAIAFRLVGVAKSWPLAAQAQKALSKAGFPVFPSISRAAGALGKFVEYHQRWQTNR